ncbi:hypothetical protein EB75_24960 [Mycobacterium sp. ST-F2]|uniref:hypothetical protein n=1 Tax=Mycobacterium sp. ST-F2 TaxID=1490484 RepID=UPI00093C6B40|nr:hypothetical protein [Mycobacterium sp. ST-F2]OKH79340.1 hypothetical protein EB75_24960 [Mycobacterium sp. ST-F2]
MLNPGDSILYMKIGTHAREDLTEIIERKRKEIEDTGLAMWGYGGNTCHPATMVQPFARSRTAAGGRIILAMEPMNSKHFAEQVRAEYSSPDGIEWTEIPKGINVLGSRYALCVKSLEQTEDELDLAMTRVAVGNSKGKRGNKYVQGRVDKACLEITNDVDSPSDHVIKTIGFVAELIEPYAVFLKN